MLKARVHFDTSLPLFSSGAPTHTAAPQLDKKRPSSKPFAGLDICRMVCSFLGLYIFLNKHFKMIFTVEGQANSAPRKPWIKARLQLSPPKWLG